MITTGMVRHKWPVMVHDLDSRRVGHLGTECLLRGHNSKRGPSGGGLKPLREPRPGPIGSRPHGYAA